MKPWTYRLPLRLAAVLLMLLALAGVTAGVLGMSYAIGQGYYERDYGSYFETPACAQEARRLAREVWELLEPMEAVEETARSEVRRAALEKYYSRERTNGVVEILWPDGSRIRNRASDADPAFRESFEMPDGSRVTVTVSGPLEAGDGFVFGQDLYRMVHRWRNGVFALLLISAMVVILVVVYLCIAAGRDFQDGHLRPGFLDMIPLDLLLLGELLAVMVTFGLLERGLQVYRAWGLYLTVYFCWILLAVVDVMTISTRVKLHTLWKNTVIYWALSGLWRVLRRFGKFCFTCFRAVPMVWRAAVVWGVLLVIQWLLGRASLPLLFLNFLLFLAGIWVLHQLKRLQIAGQVLAAGHVDYRIDTRWMLWALKEHGETLNSVGDGMKTAVARQMKSEKLKTDLITNVSHDIKTPLTSIINYVDLLRKAETPEEKEEYLAVLDRQSKRLKKLIEDLMEASKASTGNIAVEMRPTDLREITAQALAEYSSRLEGCRLEPKLNLPDLELRVLADGQQLWRVLDNLLGNVCKYAQPGTRLYVTLGRRLDKGFIEIKNVSREELNITGEELSERFVRGDRSRYTDGSGLGLNIAKSLVELQKGVFQVEIDGDLFKTTISLPLAPEGAQSL